MADMTIGGGVFKVDADLTGLDRGLIQAERKTRSSFARMGKVMAGTAVIAGGAMTAAFGKAVSGAIEQQHAFQETFTLLPDTTEKEFGKITDQAKKMAARLNVEWKDMSKGLYNAISAGIPKDNILTFMEKSAEAAAGGVATLNQAVNVGTTVMNAMTNQGLDSARAFDILFSTVRKGKTTIPELADSIGYLLPVANSLSVPLEQISAMISTLTASGIKTRVAMTSIRAGLSELADPAYKAGEAIQELTGKSFYELIKAGGDVGEILNMLYKALGPEKMAQTFGLESRAGMLSLVSEGYKKYKEDLDAAVNSSGAAREAFEKMAKTIKFQLGVAVKTLSQTLISFGAAALPIVSKAIQEDIMPAITKLSDWFIDNEDRIKQWFEDTWAVAGPILKDFIRGFVEIGKAFWKFATFIIDNKALMIASLIAISISMTAAFGPTATIVIGLVKLVTLFGHLKKKWDDIVKSNPSGTWFDHGQKLIMAIADGMRAAAVSLWNALLDSFSSLKDLLPSSDANKGPLSNLTAHGESIVTTLAQGIASSGPALFNALKKIASEIDWKGFFIGVLAGVVTYFQRMGFVALVVGALWTAMGVVTLNPGLAIVGLLTAGIGFAVSTAAGIIVDLLLGGVSDGLRSFGFIEYGKNIVVQLAKGVGMGLGYIVTAISWVLNSILDLLPSSDAKKGPLSDLTARGSAFVTTFARGIQLSGAIIGSVLHIVFSNAMGDMQASIGGWFNVGLNIVDAMAAGIITGATAIYNALSNVFASLRNLLPFSDAKEGPLSNLTLSGQSIVLTLANGIKVSAKSLSKETQSALAGLEGVLLGDGWMPSERDIEHAIGNRLSFTNFVEKGEGLIRSIDWRGLVSGGVGDIQKAAGIGDTLDPYTGGLGASLLQEAKRKAAAGKEDEGFGFEGGSFDADKIADEVEKAIAPFFDAVEDQRDKLRELMKESLIPSLEEIQAGINPIIEWFKNAFDGVIDLSFLTLPAWLSDDDGYFAWPTIKPFPDIVIPAMDFSTWELPPWLSDKEGDFEWPTPDDFAWTSNASGILSAPTWPKIIWPKWLSDDDGKFMWPTPDAFVWPTMPNIDWSLVTFPPWLSDDAGEFSMPSPGPFPTSEWTEWGRSAATSIFQGIKSGLVGTPDAVIVNEIIPGQDGMMSGLIDTGKIIIETLASGVISGRQALYNAIRDAFSWVKDLLFPSSNAKEGPFKDLTDTGKAITQTIADGIAGSGGLLYTGLETAFSTVVTSIAALFEGGEQFSNTLTVENALLESMVTPGMEGSLRTIIGLGNAFRTMGTMTGSENLVAWADGLEKISGALILLDFAVEAANDGGPLRIVEEFLRLWSDAKVEDGDPKITRLADSLMNFEFDLGLAKLTFGEEDGTLAALQELSKDLVVKYEILHPNEFFLNTMLSRALVDAVEILTALSDLFTSFTLPNLADKGAEVIQSLMNGISTAITGTDSVISPIGGDLDNVIEGQEGYLSKLKDVGKSIIGTMSDGIDAAKQSLYDAIFGVFGWVKDLLFPSSDAKEGPFKNLSTTGTAIVQTIANGIAGAGGLLLTAFSTAFTAAMTGLFAIFEGGEVLVDTITKDNPLLDSLYTPELEAPLRGAIGLSNALRTISDLTGWGNLSLWSEGLTQLSGALIMLDFATEMANDKGPLRVVEEFLRFWSEAKVEDGDPKITNLADSLMNFEFDIGLAKHAFANEESPLAALQEFSKDLVTKYEIFHPNEFFYNTMFSRWLVDVVELLTTVNDLFVNFTFTSLVDKGAEIIQSLFDGISTAFMGTDSVISPIGGDLDNVIEGKEGYLSKLTGVGKNIIEAISEGASASWSYLADALKTVFSDALASVSTFITGTPDTIIPMGGGAELVVEGTPGLAQEFSTMWSSVGDSIKKAWDTYLEGDWIAHRDLIQAGIWKSITGYGDSAERPEGATFSDFWSAVGTELKSDWDAYLENDWPAHRTTIQTALWNSLTGYDGITSMPDDLSFSSFWSELGDALLGDFNTFIANDWPGIQAKIVSLWNQALGLAGSVFEEVTGQPSDNLGDAAEESLGPGGQLAGSAALGANADAMLGKKKVWHVGRPFGMWPSQEGERRKARSPKGLLPNIPLAGMLKGVSAISAIDAGINLLEIWVPAITGEDLDTHWEGVLDWIRENVATKWLSEDTLTAMGNFSAFLIEAGATGGAFETIGDNIRRIVTDVEKAYKLEPPKQTPASIIGEITVSGIEVASSFVMESGGILAIAAALATAIPWARSVVFSKGSLHIAVAVAIIGTLEKFVLKPMFGDDILFEGESAFEQTFRRMMSSILGEDQAGVMAKVMQEKGGFWGYYLDVFLGNFTFKNDLEMTKEHEEARKRHGTIISNFADEMEELYGPDVDIFGPEFFGDMSDVEPKKGLVQWIPIWLKKLEVWWEFNVWHPIRDFFIVTIPEKWNAFWASLGVSVNEWGQIEIDMRWLTHAVSKAVENMKVDFGPIKEAIRLKISTWFDGTKGGELGGAEQPKVGFMAGLMSPDGIIGKMMSLLPEQIRLGVSGGALKGMLSGNTAAGAMGGLIQGVIWWLADTIKESSPDWSEVRIEIAKLFNPANWFSSAEGATGGDEGDDTGAFSWLTSAWASTLDGMIGKVGNWIPMLVQALSPDGGWYQQTITIFDPLLTGVAGILITMETSFQNTVTAILGFVEQVKNAWSSALGVVLAAKKKILEGQAENAALARSDLTYGYTPNRVGPNVGGPDAARKGAQQYIPGNAAGGITRVPFVGMVGEAGPELIIPLGRMSDILSDAIISSGVGVRQGSASDYRNSGRGGGGGVSITIEGDVLGLDDLENKIGEVIVDLQRTGKMDIARSR